MGGALVLVSACKDVDESELRCVFFVVCCQDSVSGTVLLAGHAKGEASNCSCPAVYALLSHG